MVSTATTVRFRQRPTVFISACVFAFVAGIVITFYYSVTMCCDMSMPGGWTMSMMWMRMPGDSWITAFLSFTFMWMAMMVAMMMPSAVSIFSNTPRSRPFLLFVALGYFTVWILPVIILYPLGMFLASYTMRMENFSHVVPKWFAVGLIAAGVFQVSRFKLKWLLQCRSLSGCSASIKENRWSSLSLGFHHGTVCLVCCTGLMTAQLMWGIMNPIAMIIITLAISAEKWLPRPALVARLIGIGIMLAGIKAIITD